MFGSVYVTAGATVAVFIGRIVTVVNAVNGAITFSTTAKSGTFPAASAGAHTITCIVGGYWKGPNGATGFPMPFVTGTLMNAASDPCRINYGNAAPYTITAAISGDSNSVTYQGMTGSPGDGGKATIDGGTSGASYTLLTAGGVAQIIDFIFQNNGATGNVDAVSVTQGLLVRCVVHAVRGNGLVLGTGPTSAVECEAYACNQANVSALAGINLTGAGSSATRCYSHDNAGSNGNGFTMLGTGSRLTDCIAESNTGIGINISNGGGNRQYFLHNCDIYNNGGIGINIASGGLTAAFIENCNLVKNTGVGISGGGTTTLGFIYNCGFGAGTQANTGGTTTTTGGMVISGSVTYPSNVTPWNAPTTGDFRIILPQAQYVGRGAFTETDGTNTGTVATPDIGAAQHSLASAGAAILFA